jgi:NADPH2:quinone reductase
MRAIQVQAYEGDDRLAVIHDAPVPDCGEGVLIDVHSAGVSFPDLLLSRGKYQIQPEPPFVPGVEAAGLVAAAGEGSEFAVGDRVAAFTFGAFADQVAAPAHAVMRLPDELTFDEGAGLVMNHQTAYLGLVVRAGLRAGEDVLVHGAAGGVGTAAVQVAKALGTQVTAVVSTGEKGDVARRAGADHVVVGLAGWRAAATASNGGRGFDVVYDPVGGQHSTDENLRALVPGGRLIVIGFADGQIPTVALNRVLLRNVSVVGAAWGHYIATRPELARTIADELTRMIVDGHVRPIVGAVYPFDEAARALADLEERRATGKLVLRVKETD